MSPRLPVLTAAHVLAALQRHGFAAIRQSGSYIILKHPDGRWTTVPMHRGDVPRGTLRQIMKDTGLTVADIS